MAQRNEYTCLPPFHRAWPRAARPNTIRLMRRLHFSISIIRVGMHVMYPVPPVQHRSSQPISAQPDHQPAVSPAQQPIKKRRLLSPHSEYSAHAQLDNTLYKKGQPFYEVGVEAFLYWSWSLIRIAKILYDSNKMRVGWVFTAALRSAKKAPTNEKPVYTLFSVLLVDSITPQSSSWSAVFATNLVERQP
ncbi:unnamed protein product, partial [Iphiclides podalirius]